MKISEEKIAAFYTWMTGIGIVIMLSLIAMVNLFHYCYKMNADIASEAVLAQLIWESGEWLPKTWYASTELRIFSTPNLASFFYGLTGSMNWAMGISCTLMTMGIMVSAYFFTGQMEFCRQSRLLFLLLCLLIPNHFVTLELMYLFAGYYSIHIIILFVILGIYAKLEKRVMKGERLPGGLMIVSWLLSFCMGMQGVRGILILSGPLVVLEIIRNGYFIAVKKQDNARNHLKILMWSLGLVIAGGIGTMLPFSVGQGISRNIRRGPEKLWNTVFPDVLRSIGITEAGSGLKIVLCIVLIIAFRRLLSIIWKMLKKQMLECSEWIYLFFWISSILTMLCVAFTTMESSERYYFLVVFLLAEALAMEVGVKFKTEAMAGRIVTLVLLITAITTIYLPILKSAEPPQNEFNEVAKFLSDKEYRIAYATFENANTITALSDGNIRVAAVASVKDMSACKWLSSSAWYVPEVPYEERTAYVVTEAEREEFEEFLLQHEGELQLETQIGKFYIFSADYNFSKLDA